MEKEMLVIDKEELRSVMEVVKGLGQQVMQLEMMIRSLRMNLLKEVNK